MPLKTFLLSIFGISLLAPSLAFAAPDFEINFQSTYTGPHIFNLEIAQPWLTEIEEKTGGKLKVHFFMSGALSKPEEVVPGLKNGTLDMAANGASMNPEIFPVGMHMGIPYSTKDAIHATALFQKMYAEVPEIKAEFDSVGKVLAIWGSDRSGLFSTKGPITNLSDLKGKRVLIWFGNQVDQIKAWGGIPVQISPNDTYVGLQRGMGDVFFGPLPTGTSFKLMEIAKDITIIPAMVGSIMIWINHDLWEDFPPEIQQAVLETTADWGTTTGEALVRMTNKDIEAMKADGCKIHTLTEEEIDAFRKADEPVVKDFIDQEFKRLKVDKTADEWLNYVNGLAESL